MIPYLHRLLPAITILLIFLLHLPRRALEFRMLAYIFIFILCRDTMTPLKMWEITSNGTLTLPGDTGMLLTLGLMSIGLVVLMQAFEHDLRRLFVWIKGSPVTAIALGLAGALLIAGPAIALQHLVFHVARTPLAGGALAALLVMALFGNCLEETLFRGYFQGYFERRVSDRHAAILSGLFFCVCHTFLATTVTDVGVTLLVFTLYEGLVTAFIAKKAGVLSSTIAHGGAIFLIASGMF